MGELAALKRKIMNLPRDELEDIRGFVALIRGSGLQAKQDGIEDAKGEDSARMMLDAFSRTLSERGLDPIPSGMLMRTQNYKAFRAKMTDDQLGAWLRGVVKNNRVALFALMHLCSELLYDDLAEKRAAINPRVMMDQVHRIPAVLNRNFPGYAQAGLLHLVIRQEGT